ncbi:MAG TPA: hypothetical protein O0X19_06305 [Methanocorpusculum sp.]|nr:hypothetical protein [Methanocorpusculum sp.]
MSVAGFAVRPGMIEPVIKSCHAVNEVCAAEIPMQKAKNKICPY